MKKFTKLSVLVYFLYLNSSFASSIRDCINDACHANRCPELVGKCNGTRIAVSNGKKLNWELLNLKTQNQQLSTNTAIEITQNDVLNVASSGNSWIKFSGYGTSMSMNIGVANSVNPQNWVLPNNFREFFDEYSQYDFISPASVPSNLRITGATHITKSPGVDEIGNEIDIFDHYIINSSEINHIGTSYDFESEEDDVFDEPDFEYMETPLNVGDEITSVIDKDDYTTNLNLFREERSITIDAFGTITIPDVGNINCLRGSYLIKFYKRANESSPYILQSTQNAVAFFTKEGHIFYGSISSQNGTIATLNNMIFQTVVPTSLLSASSDVKINNDSKAVTINTTNSEAHPSAILDISSDSLGILIPRISMANRPTSPAEGLLVYQVDNTAGFYYFDGTAWQRLSSSPSSLMAVNVRTSNSLISKTSNLRGKAQLQNGSTFIKFDQTQENFEDLIINIQLEGDCNGVFISKKTREGFEVKELKKGKSNVKFSWEIR